MPEIEPNDPPTPVVRPVCAHDPKDYRHLMPIGVSLIDGMNRMLQVLPVCPYVAIAGSLYCYAHTILRVAVTPDLKAEVEDYLRTSIRYYAKGLLIIPPLPDGTLYYPAWWSKRFN